MDHACGLRRLGAAGDCPSTALFWTRGKEGDKIEKHIAGRDQAIEPRFFQTDRSEIIYSLVRRQHRNLCFDLGGNDDGGGSFLMPAALYSLSKIVSGRS